MSKLFDIDYNKLVVALLPTFLRRPRTIALLTALAVPVKYLHVAFTRSRMDANYRLGHNGQVCYLRKLLNDYFDNDARSIRIEDMDTNQRLFIYTPGEELPRFLGEKYLYSDEGYKVSVAFTVIAPAYLDTPAELALMRNMINTYKLAGTRFNIIFE